MTEMAAAPQELGALATMAWAWAIDLVPRVSGAVLVFVVGYLAAKWTGRVIARFLARSGRVDATYIPSIRTAISYAILIFVIVAALGELGVQTTSILAALGAAGLAIGLALQGTLANIAAGIMLLWLRPFRAGEQIAVDTTEGTVREIGLFATILDAPDGSFRFVPNSQLWNKPLANFTRNPLRQAEVRVSVGRGSDIGKALTIMVAIAKADRRVAASPPPEAGIAEIGDVTMVLALRAWTQSADYATLRGDLRVEAQRWLNATDLTLVKPAGASSAAPEAKQ